LRTETVAGAEWMTALGAEGSSRPKEAGCRRLLGLVRRLRFDWDCQRAPDEA